MNRHIMWTIPTVNLVVFGFCGLVAALVLRARPRLGVRVAVSPLVFLATLTLLLSCRWLHVLACLVLAFLFAFRLTRRIESSLPAFRRLVRRDAARAGGAGGRRDRVVARRADSWRTPGGRSPARGISGWSGRSRSERHACRPRHGAGRSPEPLRISPRYDPEPGAAGPPRRAVRAGAVDGSLDVAVAREHDDRALATPDFRPGLHGPLDGTHPTIAGFLAEQRVCLSGLRREHHVLRRHETGLDRGFAHYEDHDLTPRGDPLHFGMGSGSSGAGHAWRKERLVRLQRAQGRRPQGRRSDQPRPSRLDRQAPAATPDSSPF